MSVERRHILITAVVAIVIPIAAWLWLHDGTLSLYVGLVGVLVTAVLWKWPKEEWLATGRLRQIHNSLGSRRLDRSYKTSEQIVNLSHQLYVKNFFVADWLEECSGRLVREIHDALVKKVIAYVIAFLVLCIVTFDTAHEEVTAIHLTLKIGASLALFGFPLAWDYSRWVRQRNLNLELRSPDASLDSNKT